MTDQAPEQPEIRVRGGASAEEVAAVVVALGTREPAAEPRRDAPPWLRAGLREALGERPALAPPDLG